MPIAGVRGGAAGGTLWGMTRRAGAWALVMAVGMVWLGLRLGLGVAVEAAPGAGGGGETVLFDAAAGPDPGRWAASGSEVRAVAGGDRPMVELRTGTGSPWPGAGWRSPEGGWDLGGHTVVEVELTNLGAEGVKVFCRVDNPGADGRRHCVTGDATLGSGEDGVLRVWLARHAMERAVGDLFGMRGYPAEPGGEWTVDPSRVTQVLLFVDHPVRSHAIGVRRIRAAGRHVAPTASWSDARPFVPFIDTFGQYRHRDWPGKVKSEDDLRRRREDEAAELRGKAEPAGWSRYGGWAAGPRREGTGYFRVEKVDGRWWFVDPDGWLFWSHGVDCVRMLDYTVVEERMGWFEDFPGLKPELAGFHGSLQVLKGHYAGRKPGGYSFAGANLRRKYGADWSAVYAEVVHRRLRSWGMNTVANWSARDVTKLRRTPYTDSLDSGGAPRIAGSEGYWGKFPDVFDDRFVAGLRRGMAGKAGGSAGDPWCLGYFSDNEMSWGDAGSLAEATIRSPADQPAKRAFMESLKARYGTVAALNAGWGSSHASWEDWLASRDVPDRKRARTDLEAFYDRMADTYFGTVRRVIREFAPRQLYLGCRFSAVNDRAAAAAARHCDVVSYNLYQRSVADYVFPGGADVPLLIGEFHFGALDRGLFHTGLVAVEDQEARARAYREYVEGALRHPQFVGTHWFQWQDEPTTGRAYDEENYQIGLVDIADTPYAELIGAVRAVGEGMYRLRSAGGGR